MRDAPDSLWSVGAGNLPANYRYPVDYRLPVLYAHPCTRQIYAWQLEGFISPVAMRRFAEYMDGHRVQADGSLRDSDNWQAGFPRRQTIKSLVRHAWDLWYEWRRGKDEVVMVDLLCAVIFNAQSLLLEITLERDVKE